MVRLVGRLDGHHGGVVAVLGGDLFGDGRGVGEVVGHEDHTPERAGVGRRGFTGRDLQGVRDRRQWNEHEGRNLVERRPPVVENHAT